MSNLSSVASVLLINGHRKSGTTLLSLLFDCHPHVLSVPTDLNCLYAFYPRWSGHAYQLSEKLKRYKRVTIEEWQSIQAINQCEYIRGLDYIDSNAEQFNKDLTFTEIFDFTIQLLISLKRQEKSLIVCKETSTEMHQATIAAASVHNVKTLTVFRDPRDNIAALKRGSSNYYAPLGDSWLTTMMSALFRIKLSHAFTAKSLLHNPDVHQRIRYEDLCKDSVERMSSIATWLGISHDPCLLKPTVNGLPFEGNSFSDHALNKAPGIHIDGKNIGQWKTVLTRPESALTEIFLEQMLSDLGYDYALTNHDFSEAADMYSMISHGLFFSDRFQ